mmetsp:Transcript_6115/g.14336  ORF Transcript_6115/g.14336 Transcript_6115/m.14336 type:complete len:644 (-) Transcript_6115:1671-3602(-)
MHMHAHRSLSQDATCKRLCACLWVRMLTNYLEIYPCISSSCDSFRRMNSSSGQRMSDVAPGNAVQVEVISPPNPISEGGMRSGKIDEQWLMSGQLQGPSMTQPSGNQFDDQFAGLPPLQRASEAVELAHKSGPPSDMRKAEAADSMLIVGGGPDSSRGAPNDEIVWYRGFDETHDHFYWFNKVTHESCWSAPEGEDWVDADEDDSESDNEYEYEDADSSAAFVERGISGGGRGGGGGHGSVGWRPLPTQGSGLAYSNSSLPTTSMLPIGVTPLPAPVPTESPPIPFNINERLGWKRSAQDLTILRVQPHTQAHQAGVVVGSKIASVDGIRVSNQDEYSAAIATAKAKSWLSTVEFTFILAGPATDGRYKGGGSSPSDNSYGGYDGSVWGRGEGGGQGERAQGPPRMMLPHSPMMAREPSNHSVRSNGSNQDSTRWGRGDSGRFRSSQRSSRSNSAAAEEEMPAPPPLVSTPSTHSVHESASMSNTNLSLILERGQAAMHLQTQNCCICYDSKPLGLSCNDDDTPHFICSDCLGSYAFFEVQVGGKYDRQVAANQNGRDVISASGCLPCPLFGVHDGCSCAALDESQLVAILGIYSAENPDALNSYLTARGRLAVEVEHRAEEARLKAEGEHQDAVCCRCLLKL